MIKHQDWDPHRSTSFVRKSRSGLRRSIRKYRISCVLRLRLRSNDLLKLDGSGSVTVPPGRNSHHTPSQIRRRETSVWLNLRGDTWELWTIDTLESVQWDGVLQDPRRWHCVPTITLLGSTVPKIYSHISGITSLNTDFVLCATYSDREYSVGC